MVGMRRPRERDSPRDPESAATAFYDILKCRSRYSNQRVLVLERSVGSRPELIEREEHIEQAARVIKAMAHPLRLKILCVLGEREFSVQDIVDSVGTSQSNISQHLAILREKGVLRTRKDANRVFYRISDQRTLQLLGMMREVLCGSSH